MFVWISHEMHEAWEPWYCLRWRIWEPWYGRRCQVDFFRCILQQVIRRTIPAFTWYLKSLAVSMLLFWSSLHPSKKTLKLTTLYVTSDDGTVSCYVFIQDNYVYICTCLHQWVHAYTCKVTYIHLCAVTTDHTFVAGTSFWVAGETLIPGMHSWEHISVYITKTELRFCPKLDFASQWKSQ